MAQVYVRWYGNVVQGELLDGEYLGMKQVRIPLDGRHPVALFTPGHVYETIEAVPTCYPVKDPSVAISDMIKGHYEISQKESVAEFIEHTIDMQRVENFKCDNWDQEHNHLRIDKLDEFYQLWRMVMTPVGFKEPVFKPLLTERDIDELAEEFKNYDGVIFNPDAKITTILPAEAPVTLPSHKEKPVSAEAVHESCTPSQQPLPNKPAAITSPYPEITQGYSKTTQPYPKKIKKPQIVELSLFE